MFCVFFSFVSLGFLFLVMSYISLRLFLIPCFLDVFNLSLIVKHNIKI